MQSLHLLRRGGGARPAAPRPPPPTRAAAPGLRRPDQAARAVAIPPSVPYNPNNNPNDDDDEQAAAAAEEAVRSGWDPDGLFKGASALAAAAARGAGAGGGDLFARQQARRAEQQRQRELELEQQQQQQQLTSRPTPTFDEPPVAVPDDWWPASDGDGDGRGRGDGPLVAALSAAQRAELAAAVAAVFPTLDLARPGLRVLHLRPPVLAIDGFASPADCEAWMREADASGRLATSRVGAGHAGGGSASSSSPSPAAAPSVSYDAAQRTSTNLLVDPATRRAAPVLGLMADAFQERALELMDAVAAAPAAPAAGTAAGAAAGVVTGADGAGPPPPPQGGGAATHHHRPGAAWGEPSRMPAPRQYTFEAPQVTRYLPPMATAAAGGGGRARGQLFGEHEDAFPRVVARANGFQRHATLLLYLNGREPSEGGATCFAHLRPPARTGDGGENGEGAARPLAVTPRAGRLLIFFPSADDGTPDARTLHAAEEVVSGGPKWVMQQWVARGYASPSALRQMQQQGQQEQQQEEEALRPPVTRKERRERARQEAAAAKQQQQGGPRRKKA